MLALLKFAEHGLSLRPIRVFQLVLSPQGAAHDLDRLLLEKMPLEEHQAVAALFALRKGEGIVDEVV